MADVEGLDVGQNEPKFESVDEMADWFDANDTSQLGYEESFAPPEGRRPLATVAVRLPGAQVEALKKRAAALGVGYTTYVRMVIARHLREKPITVDPAA